MVNKTDEGYKLDVNRTSKFVLSNTSTLKINSNSPFYLRLWYSLTNPFTYLFSGKRRY